MSALDIALCTTNTTSSPGEILTIGGEDVDLGHSHFGTLSYHSVNRHEVEITVEGALAGKYAA